MVEHVVYVGLLFFLGRIALAQVIPPIATHFSVVWSVFQLSVTFMHAA